MCSKEYVSETKPGIVTWKADIFMQMSVNGKRFGILCRSMRKLSFKVNACFNSVYENQGFQTAEALYQSRLQIITQCKNMRLNENGI